MKIINQNRVEVFSLFISWVSSSSDKSKSEIAELGLPVYYSTLIPLFDLSKISLSDLCERMSKFMA